MSSKSPKPVQYTIRRIPEQTDQLLRERAPEYGCSLNEAALHALQSGLGQGGGTIHKDFDKYANTWVKDEVVDEVLQEFSRIDEGMWS